MFALNTPVLLNSAHPHSTTPLCPLPESCGTEENGRLFLFSLFCFFTFLWENINIYLPIAGPRANNSAKCTTGNISAPPSACGQGPDQCVGGSPEDLKLLQGCCSQDFFGWFVNKAFMWLVRLTRLSASWGSGFYFCFSAFPFNLLSSRFFLLICLEQPLIHFPHLSVVLCCSLSPILHFTLLWCLLIWKCHRLHCTDIKC